MADAFVAFLNDANSRRVVEEVDQRVEMHRGSVRNASWEYRKRRSPDILLVDMDGEQNPIVYVPALMQVCRPESIILVTGSENNVTLANELYRSGVFLYLPKPLDVNNLRQAINEVETDGREGARPQIQTSRVIPVLGKGMGVNTFTALLAHLAADAGRYVTCLDLDPNFGSLSLALDAEPARGLAQTLQSQNDDPAALDRLQAEVSHRVSLVAHPMDQAGQNEFSEGGLPSLVEGLCTQAHMILACGVTPAHVAALRHAASNHVMVFEPTPAGVSIAVRWLRILEGAPCALVANHTRPLPKLFGADQLRTAFGGRTPDLELPYIKRMAHSMALGEPQKALGRHEREVLNQFLQPLLGLGATMEEAVA